MPIIIALLHLAPRPGEIEANKRMIEQAVLRASAMGAKFIVTPELVVSGYGFRDLIGSDWIERDQTALFEWAGRLARRAAAVLVLGTPEARPDDGKLFNSMVLFAPDGTRLGHHRKINVLKQGSESWSTPGECVTSVAVDDIGRLGLFVCADMYSRRLVEETAAQDVDLLVSSAAWAPGHHGPNGEWEWASWATKRTVLVCNRTGVDVMDFSTARTVGAAGGSVVYAHASVDPALILVDWDAAAHALTNWCVVAFEE